MAIFEKPIELTKVYEHKQEMISGISSRLPYGNERISKLMTAHSE